MRATLSLGRRAPKSIVVSRRWQRAWARFAAAMLVGALLTGAGRSARAQEDPKVAARAKLVEGSDLLKRGEFRDALVRFQEAYVLVPSPKIFYNFGLAYMGLSRNADAMDVFERFITETTDIAPDLRANAERYIATLALQTGSVIIDCDAAGAEISIDGRSRGVTPAKGPIRLDPGPHQLVVEKAGMPPYTRKLTIDGGQKLIVDVHLGTAVGPAPPPVIIMQTPPSPAPVQPPPKPTQTWRFRIGVGLGALAVVALGYGVAEWQASNSHFNDFNSKLDGSGNKKCDSDNRVFLNGGADCQSLLNEGNSARRRETVGLIAGGVLAAGTAALLAMSWNDRMVTKETALRDGDSRRWSSLLVCRPDLLRPGLACALRF